LALIFSTNTKKQGLLITKNPSISFIPNQPRRSLWFHCQRRHRRVYRCGNRETLSPPKRTTRGCDCMHMLHCSMEATANLGCFRVIFESDSTNLVSHEGRIWTCRKPACSCVRRKVWAPSTLRSCRLSVLLPRL
jgi:hypothetical protein